MLAFAKLISKVIGLLSPGVIVEVNVELTANTLLFVREPPSAWKVINGSPATEPIELETAKAVGTSLSVPVPAGNKLPSADSHILFRPNTVEVPLMSKAGEILIGSPGLAGGVKVPTAPVVLL